MRTLSLTFFLAIVSNLSFAQKTSVFRIDSLPKQGILLDKNWKWHAGDNPDFAKADFDDSAWEGIDPNKDINELPNVKKATFGWLRLRYKINRSLSNTIIGLMINQHMIASEIYCNEKQIAKFGIISSNKDKIKAYNPSGEINGPSEIISFYTDSLQFQIIAIRYAVQPKISNYHLLNSPTPFLKIILNKTENLNENNVLTRGYFDSSFLDHFEGGLFFILSLLHLLFFNFYRTNKANLYFGLFCVFSTAYFLIQAYIFEFVHFVELRFFISFIYLFFYTSSMILLLLAVYTLFNHRKGFIFKFLIVFFTLGYFVKFFDSQLATLILIILLVLANLEVARISIIGLRNKKSGGLIIFIGAIIYAISTIMYISNEYITSNLLYYEVIKHSFYNIANLSLPISITLFLSREFAKTTKSLGLKLIENENLYNEKQQILSTQNETLEKQVKERTTELQHSIDKLKATQAQLIQSEKLASLGELTAGIAHEIQNPLNFVNNFSELSVELIEELKSPLIEASNRPDGGMIDIKSIDMELFDDIMQNLEKINLHGKRASSIVKGMLEHSRASTGIKELTDINKLADESLRLSYHGLRAKDKTFNADFELIADPNLPKINVIPQDIGRVLINLINNAFYAVSGASSGTPAASLSHRNDFSPKVTVTTSPLPIFGEGRGGVLVRVTDNGTGMSEATKAKIFQPFFTTKPTGQGTGLGLSLAYDIVTKGHGGTLEVETKEGEFTEFIIKIPYI